MMLGRENGPEASSRAGLGASSFTLGFLYPITWQAGRRKGEGPPEMTAVYASISGWRGSASLTNDPPSPSPLCPSPSPLPRPCTFPGEARGSLCAESGGYSEVLISWISLGSCHPSSLKLFPWQLLPLLLLSGIRTSGPLHGFLSPLLQTLAAQGFFLGPESFPVLPGQLCPVSDFDDHLYVENSTSLHPALTSPLSTQKLGVFFFFGLFVF